MPPRMGGFLSAEPRSGPAASTVHGEILRGPSFNYPPKVLALRAGSGSRGLNATPVLPLPAPGFPIFPIPGHAPSART